MTMATMKMRRRRKIDVGKEVEKEGLEGGKGEG